MVNDSDVDERVTILENLRLEDDQPNIEAPAMSIACDTTMSFNFQDRGAYDTHWIDETLAMEKLEEILKAGEKFIYMVYTYRSCSKALPQVKSQAGDTTNQHHLKIYEVLEPEVKKLKDFMYFQKDTTKVFCDLVKKLSTTLKDKKKSEDFIISESMIMYFIRMLDLLALLDALKNMKANLNNDFSFYKRSFSLLRSNMIDDQSQENNTLYLFLANQNSITTNLKMELQAIDGFDDVMGLLVNQCADYFEAERYLLPTEKHCLLRVMPYALFLMDGEKVNIYKKKDMNLSKFARIFKKNPVVPLFGDMQITLESFIKRTPHYDEKVWGMAQEDPKIAQEYEILHLLQATRTAHNEYVAKFGNVINDIKTSQRASAKYSPTPAESREVTNVVLQGLQLLSDWSSKVLQQSAWKYARPNNDPTVNSLVDYERVVKYNYTSEERFALVEFIAMIKGVAGLLMRSEAVLTPIIKTAIHDEIQEFVQVNLRDLIREVSKKKKVNLRNELLQLRALAADWQTGVEPLDPVLYGKKPTKDEEKVVFPARAVAPNVTQLVLIRNIVYGLICKKKDISTKLLGSNTKLDELDKFYARSFFYKYLVSIVPTVVTITDLADLWYREFYLELSRRLQFPIDMSLPWILTDHILESRDAAMMESVLYPLDIYNDAAHRALVKLGTRFLYDEIEAEVNLCFDQLLYKLSEEIYTWFKIQASTILMDKPYRSQLEVVSSAGRFNVPKSRYDVIMRQRHFQLLGRSLDLNNLLSQRQNTYIRQNLEYAISRFEASDLTCLLELENQLMNIQLTHKMMSQHFALDSWDSMLSEINESTSLASFHGRIVLHIIFELMYDFLPNFNYNTITQRFVRGPPQSPDPVPRESMPKTNIQFLYGNKALTSAYANSSELGKKFVGLSHFHSLMRMVGRSGLPLVIGEILRNMELKLLNVLGPYAKELQSGMPASSKLPIHDYGTEGGYGYFQLKLKDIFTYPDLKTEVFHNFRFFGNAIVLLNLLDLTNTQLGVTTFLLSAPFLGHTPGDMNPNENESPLFVNLQRVAAFLESKPELPKCAAAIKDIVTNAWRGDRLYRPAPTQVSIFKSVLARINAMLDPVRAEWSGSAPDNGVLPVDFTSEFYRLWSALQFVVCVPPSTEDEGSYHEVFGDGLMWAGCTIIHFLGQQRRFDTFDFSYHILNVEEAAAVPCQKPNVRQFFRTVSIMKDLNQVIFSILNTYSHVPPNQVHSGGLFHPPATETEQQQFITLPEERESARLQHNVNTSSGSITMGDGTPPPPPPPTSGGYDIPPPPPMGDDDFAPPPPPPMDFGPPPPMDFVPPPPMDFAPPPPPPF